MPRGSGRSREEGAVRRTAGTIRRRMRRRRGGLRVQVPQQDRGVLASRSTNRRSLVGDGMFRRGGRTRVWKIWKTRRRLNWSTRRWRCRVMGRFMCTRILSRWRVCGGTVLWTARGIWRGTGGFLIRFDLMRWTTLFLFGAVVAFAAIDASFSNSKVCALSRSVTAIRLQSWCQSCPPHILQPYHETFVRP